MNITRFITLLLCFHTFGLFAAAGPWGLDPSFGANGKVLSSPEGNELIRGNGYALLPDGKILAAVNQVATGTPRGLMLARYNSNGSLDTTFGTGGLVTILFGPDNQWEYAMSVAVQPDGKILVGGDIGKPVQQVAINSFAVARLNPDGSLDNSFDDDGKAVVSFTGYVGSMVTVRLKDIRLAPDGKIVLSGESYDVGLMITRSVVARINSNGSIDNSFDNDGRLSVSSFIQTVDAAVLPDNSIILVGYSYAGFDFSYRIAVKLNVDGTEAWEYNDGAMCWSCENFFGVAAMPDGRFIIAGRRSGRIGLFRLNANGTLDPSFGTINQTPIGQGHSIAVQADGKIVMNAQLGSGQGGPSNFSLMRFNSDGLIDTTFGIAGAIETRLTSGTDHAFDLLIDPQGRILAGGYSHLISPTRYYVSMVRFRAGDAVAPHDPLFDFDGDWRSDLSIFRPASGQWWLRRSVDQSSIVLQFGIASDALVPGDFSGDGRTDTAVWRPSNGQWYILRSENYSYYAFPYGADGDIPVPADFDGDDKADAAVFRPSNSTWFIRRSIDSQTQIVQFGAAGDVPVPADYDGDGKTDVAIFRANGASGGEWWINRSSGGISVVNFGAPGDLTVPADYTGDRKSDIAVWRPSTGEWLILRSEDLSYYSTPFGMSGDQPLPSDYDGDGKADLAIFRSGVWYVAGTASGVQIVGYGSAGDRPVPASFVR